MNSSLLNHRDAVSAKNSNVQIFSFRFLLFTLAIFLCQFSFNPNQGFSQAVITAVYDGPLTGGTPKGVEIYFTADVADLTEMGIGSANNGGGSDGEEFTFPAGSVSMGDYLYIASEGVQFNNFFGFDNNWSWIRNGYFCKMGTTRCVGDSGKISTC